MFLFCYFCPEAVKSKISLEHRLQTKKTAGKSAVRKESAFNSGRYINKWNYSGRQYSLFSSNKVAMVRKPRPNRNSASQETLIRYGSSRRGCILVVAKGYKVPCICTYVENAALPRNTLLFPLTKLNKHDLIKIAHVSPQSARFFRFLRENYAS